MYNLREKKRQDYKAMASKGKNPEQDAVELVVDRKGEKELLSESQTGESSGKSDVESEVSNRDISDDELDEIDENELEKVLEEKEKELDVAKSELEKQKEEEKRLEKQRKQEEEEEERKKRERRKARKEKEEKRNRIKRLLSKIKTIEKETESVEKETSSRNNTPQVTPVGSPVSNKKRSKSGNKENEGEGKKIPIINENITPDFAEMVTSALNKGATLASECESELVGMTTDEALKHSLERATSKVDKCLESNKQLTVSKIIEMLSQISKKETVNATNSNNNREKRGPNSEQLNARSHEQYTKVTDREGVESTISANASTCMSTSDSCKTNITGNKRKKKKSSRKQRNSKSGKQDESEASSSSEEDTQKSGKTQNIKSGKFTNPDHVGIKVRVGYPHHKLNMQFVKEREFDKLPFHFFIAGELELILDDSIKWQSDEKKSRLEILRDLCYNREYLEIEDLRRCYESIMKEIETGRTSWGKSLVEKVHQFCQFTANVQARERLTKQSSITSKSVIRKKEADDKIYFCSDYNREGGCIQGSHHEGRFNNKPAHKWHICKKCFLETKEKKYHSELDPICPRRGT